MRAFVVTVSIAVIGALCAPVAQNASAARVDDRASQRNGPPRDMHLVFADDFSGPSLDLDKWDTCYPWADQVQGCTNFGNPELEWNLPSQVRLSDGALHLVSEQIPTPGTTRDGAPKTYDLRSGMVTSYRAFAFEHGYVSVRARAPKGEGLWTAFFLLPVTQKWPPEIDIAEVFGNDTKSVHVVHHPLSGPQNVRNVKMRDASKGWHTFAVNWEPDSITWYVDGKRIFRFRGKTPAEPMYFLANLAVAYLFGAGPKFGPPALASVDIDKVEIYQR